jgi:hypothetical protein
VHIGNMIFLEFNKISHHSFFLVKDVTEPVSSTPIAYICVLFELGFIRYLWPVDFVF